MSDATSCMCDARISERFVQRQANIAKSSYAFARKGADESWQVRCRGSR